MGNRGRIVFRAPSLSQTMKEMTERTRVLRRLCACVWVVERTAGRRREREARGGECAGVLLAVCAPTGTHRGVIDFSGGAGSTGLSLVLRRLSLLRQPHLLPTLWFPPLSNLGNSPHPFFVVQTWQVTAATDCGASAKFTGSGGCAVCVCPGGAPQAAAVRAACDKEGFVMESVTVHSPSIPPCTGPTHTELTEQD